MQWCAGLDVDDAAAAHLVAFWWLTEVHRERPLQDDERLLLESVPVPFAGGAGLVAPEVRARMREARVLAQLGDVPRRFPRLMWAGDPRS
jgi:hypothetical protein